VVHILDLQVDSNRESARFAGFGAANATHYSDAGDNGTAGRAGIIR